MNAKNLTLATITAMVLFVGIFINFTNSTVSFETPIAYALGGDSGGDGGSGGSSGGDCCNTGGGNTGGGNDDGGGRDEDPVFPSCVINAAPSTVTAGGNSTLTWTTTNANAASINQTIGAVEIGTNKTRAVLNLTNTITYRMTVTSTTGNSATCETTVTVNPVVVPAPSCVLIPTPTTINQGGSSRLTWTSQNTAGVGTINQGVGDVDPRNTAGYRDVSPSATTTYTMTVRNSAGVEATCNATVNVIPPAPQAPRCDNFDATPVTINRGQSSTLSWNTTNADTVSIDKGVGTQNVDGSVLVSPLENTTYTLTMTKAGFANQTCTRTVTVIQPNVFSCSNNVNFYAARTSIEEGESTSLIWTTTGVTSLTISNLSTTALSGNETVSPRSDIEYVMNISNGSQSDTCRVNINVNEDNGGSSGGSSSPKCTLRISDSSIKAGERVELKWETSAATRVVLRDNFGKILVTTDGKMSRDKSDLYDGEISLRPEKDTTYTLLAERGSRDRECKVSVDVSGSVTVLQTRDQQPVVTGISLTQVPYTGFEAGPVLTMIFYGLLVLWALYLAYVLVVRRNGGMGVTAVHAVTTPIMPAVTEVASPVVTTQVTTPRFVSAAPVESNVAAAFTPVVGYGATVARDEVYETAAMQVEDMAHQARVLLSGEAMRHLVEATNDENRATVVATLLDKATASYPTEDGWVVITIDRMKSLLAVQTPVATPSPFMPAAVAAGQSSLAEAIVTGNIVAAYQLIGNRPMISLAEAAAELDALYRVKQGHSVTISQLLATEGNNFSIEQVKAAIAALTGALDGTYTNEAEAVKMAILKAIKSLN